MERHPFDVTEAIAGFDRAVQVFRAMARFGHPIRVHE
jgi:hypothetical protein